MPHQYDEKCQKFDTYFHRQYSFLHRHSRFDFSNARFTLHTSNVYRDLGIIRWQGNHVSQTLQKFFQFKYINVCRVVADVGVFVF